MDGIWINFVSFVYILNSTNFRQLHNCNSIESPSITARHLFLLHVYNHCSLFRLLLGFMSVTAFLSMWISNTATAAMMLPIAHAVLQETKSQTKEEAASNDDNSEDVRLMSARYSRTYDSAGEESERVLVEKSSTNENTVLESSLDKRNIEEKKEENDTENLLK